MESFVVSEVATIQAKHKLVMRRMIAVKIDVAVHDHVKQSFRRGILSCPAGRFSEPGKSIREKSGEDASLAFEVAVNADCRETSAQGNRSDAESFHAALHENRVSGIEDTLSIIGSRRHEPRLIITLL